MALEVQNTKELHAGASSVLMQSQCSLMPPPSLRSFLSLRCCSSRVCFHSWALTWSPCKSMGQHAWGSTTVTLKGLRSRACGAHLQGAARWNPLKPHLLEVHHILAPPGVALKGLGQRLVGRELRVLDVPHTLGLALCAKISRVFLLLNVVLRRGLVVCARACQGGKQLAVAATCRPYVFIHAQL